MSLTVSVDVKQHWTMLSFRHWSQFVPNTSTSIRGQEALHHHERFGILQKPGPTVRQMMVSSFVFIDTTGFRNVQKPYRLMLIYRCCSVTDVSRWIKVSAACCYGNFNVFLLRKLSVAMVTLWGEQVCMNNTDTCVLLWHTHTVSKTNTLAHTHTHTKLKQTHSLFLPTTQTATQIKNRLLKYTFTHFTALQKHPHSHVH